MIVPLHIRSVLLGFTTVAFPVGAVVSRVGVMAHVARRTIMHSSRRCVRAELRRIVVALRRAGEGGGDGGGYEWTDSFGWCIRGESDVRHQQSMSEAG